MLVSYRNRSSSFEREDDRDEGEGARGEELNAEICEAGNGDQSLGDGHTGVEFKVLQKAQADGLSLFLTELRTADRRLHYVLHVGGLFSRLPRHSAILLLWGLNLFEGCPLHGQCYWRELAEGPPELVLPDVRREMEDRFTNLEAQLPLLIPVWKELASSWDKAGKLLEEAGFTWPDLVEVARRWESAGRRFFTEEERA